MCCLAGIRRWSTLACAVNHTICLPVLREDVLAVLAECCNLRSATELCIHSSGEG